MKRFVYVPHFLIENDLVVPKEAEKLAKDAQLSVRVGSIGDGINRKSISIISVPEFCAANHDKTVKSGRIFSVDVTNEFLNMGRETRMETVSPAGVKISHKPTVLERHVVKFRTRFHEAGKYEFAIFDNDEKFLVSSFEVV